jgi:hypothetical protein
MLETPYTNDPRANAAVADGKKVFTLALPRSVNRPWITDKSEHEARTAAAKLCQRKGLRIEHVWFKDGMHPELGMYRRWYMVMTAPRLSRPICRGCCRRSRSG